MLSHTGTRCNYFKQQIMNKKYLSNTLIKILILYVECKKIRCLIEAINVNN